MPIDNKGSETYLASIAINQQSIMNIDFSPEKSLFSLPIVRWCAGTTVLISAGIFFVIAFNVQNYPLDFSGIGFNKFAEFYKVPAAFLAIGFTLVGLCAANHRSEQTKKQIEKTSHQISLTTTQNTFANHYKNLEEFEKYLTSLNKKNDDDYANVESKNPKTNFYTDEISIIKSPHIERNNYRKLYRRIYPESKNGNYLISENFLNQLSAFQREILKLFNSFNKIDIKTRQDAEFKISKLLDDFSKLNGISINLKNIALVVKFHDEEDEFNFHSLKRLAVQFIKLIKVVDETLHFDTDYKSSDFTMSMLSVNIKKIPELNFNINKIDTSTYSTKIIFPREGKKTMLRKKASSIFDD